MKLTDWYPKTTHPARPGIYQILFFEDAISEDKSKIVSYCYWDGTHWHQSFSTAASKYSKKVVKILITNALRSEAFNSKQELSWRGILRNDTTI